MNSITLPISLAALAASSVLLAGCSEPTSSSVPAKAEWSYTGDNGPSHWGDLSPDYAMAKDGREQSPIDIAPETADEAELRPLEFAYESTTIDILNNGHTIEDDYHGGGTLTVDGHAYRLAQFHFHSPSEHTVDGVHFPMEMHLVHKDSEGALAVVSVMFQHGESNAALATLEEHFPTEPGRAERVKGMSVNAEDLLPKSRMHYRYDGSLTTPPCSEGVKWFVMQEPVQASKEQVELFHSIIDDNNRPTQPLHGRAITRTR